MVGNTLYRNTDAGTEVTVTAELLYEGKTTGLKAERNVTFAKVRDALSVSAEAGGQTIASGAKTNQDITLTVTGETGKSITYRVDGGPWQEYSASITVSAQSEEKVNATYTFAYSDQQGQTVKHASFVVDLSKVTPAVDGVTNGELPVNEGAEHINSITLPESITAELDGAPYSSGSDISGGTHTLVLTDDYGNTSTLNITVPTYQVSWETPAGGTITVNAALTQQMLANEQTFTRGTAVTITATPDFGYSLGKLQVNGSDFPSGSTISVMQDMTVTAEFEVITDPVIVTAAAGGASYASGSKTNQDVTITAALNSGVEGTLEYSTNGTEWLPYPAEGITVTASAEVNQTTYQFRVKDHADQTTVAFSVDILKKTPSIAGVADGGTLSGNTITVPEGYTVFLDGAQTAYVSGAEITSGTHTVHMQDAYGNTNTVTVTVPASTVPSNPGHSGNTGGSSSAVYRPVVEDATHGDVTLSTSRPERGDTVIITPQPEAGYEVESVTVTDRSGNAVAVTNRGDGTWSFVQPVGSVTVEVTFQETAQEPAELPFTDVPGGAWYEDAVRYVYEAGMMAGTSSTDFLPDGDMTRAMVVTVLARYEGVDTAAGENWYDAGRQWAMENHISDGTDINGSITREQLVTMLYRYAGSPAGAGSLTGFADAASVSSWAGEAMAWAVNAGVINGKDGNRLDPQGTATRAEVAQVLMNFSQNVMP